MEVIDLPPAGRAVSMRAEIDGRDGRVVLLPGGGEMWVSSYRSDGTEQSSVEFEEMLDSLTIPTT